MSDTTNSGRCALGDDACVCVFSDNREGCEKWLTGSPVSREAAELLEIVTSRAADFSRKAADDLYECLLRATQDYLIDNARFNIGERIAAANRQARHDREAWGKAEARATVAERRAASLLEMLKVITDCLEDVGDGACGINCERMGSFDYAREIRNARAAIAKTTGQ